MKAENNKTFSEELTSISGKEAVIFGNSKNKDSFDTGVEFSVFGGEEVFGLLAEKKYSNDPTLNGDELLIEDNDDAFYCKKHSDDIFKFGLILKKKPKKNNWSFNISGHDNLDFFYQPPLANENPDGSTWEENDRGGISQRPADVNGSYAVYHKTRRDHILGQKNYATGKVCHIYRPKFIDANGDWTWGDILIESGIYKVSCPQTFLDNATYPVKANDTFGYTSLGASTDSGNNDNYLAAKPYQTPASNGTLTNITIAAYDDSGAANNLKMCLYDESGGVPNNPIANSSTGAVNVTRNTAPTSDTSTWTQGTTGAASITASTNYWQTFVTDDATVKNMYDTAASDLWARSGFYSGFPATPFPAGGTSYNIRLSIFATYTPTAGAKPSNLMLMGVS